MNKKTNRIYLRNRYGVKNYLEKISDDEYALRFDPMDESSLIRVIGNPEGPIEAIDPSGGPFISVGDELDNAEKLGKIQGIRFDKEAKSWILTIK